MALKLPHSVFCHIGRTGGHWVRRVLEEQGLSRGEVAGFHDWPSRYWNADPALAETFTFCFIRHPLSWLRSYWMHHMQFGWEDFDEYARRLRSWSFAEFLERSIQEYPEGPVSRMFAPFVSECSFVGRQEDLRLDLVDALGKAGETFNALLIDDRPVGIPIEQDIRRHAKAPVALLNRVMDVERDLCSRWGYRNIPEGIVGEAKPFCGPFFDLSRTQGQWRGRPTPKSVIQCSDRTIVTPYLASDDGGSVIVTWGELTYFGRYSALKRTVLDTLQLAGRDILCVYPKDLVIPLYLLGRDARSVTVVSDDICAKEYADSCSQNGLNLVTTFSGALKQQPRGADIVISLAELAVRRHPFYYLRMLERQLKAGGMLVLDASIVENGIEMPALFCPRPENALECEYAVSYFNSRGLEDTLKSLAFAEVNFVVKQTYNVPGDRPPYLLELRKNAADELGMNVAFARCVVIARKASEAQAETSGTRNVLLEAPWRFWDREIESGSADSALSDSGDPEASSGAVLARLEEIERLKSQVRYWQNAHEDRSADLARSREQAEILLRELTDRTKELVEVRELLVDRTRRLEQVLAGQDGNGGN